MKNPNRFFVYCLYRPWNGEPCYVGKGSGARIQQHFADGEKHCNPHLGNILKKAGGKLPYVILFADLDEQTAFRIECELIAAVGRKVNGGPLVNLTDGGEGVSGSGGWKHTPETIAHLTKIALTRSDQQSLRMRGNQHTKGRKLSAEHVEKIKRSNTGRKHSEASKFARSLKMKARWSDPVERAEMEAHNRRIAQLGAEAMKRKGRLS